jgi:hypothetical protein
MTYRLFFDRNNFLVFDIDAMEIESQLGDFFMLREPVWQNFWKTLPAQFRDDSDGGAVAALPDITLWMADCLAMNEKAYTALSAPLEEYGEFLSVTCEGVPYWVLHVTKVVDSDAVDLTSSEREIDESGYVDIKTLRFVDEQVKDLLIFRSEYTDGRNVYCSDKFKSIIDDNGLKGLIFDTELAPWW